MRQSMVSDEALEMIASSVKPDDLPGDLPEVAEVVGVVDALRLARDVGCGRIYLRRWTNDQAKWSQDLVTIVNLIGEQKAKMLSDWFGGAHIDIPRCDSFWRAWRNKCIREARGMRQIDLARMHGLSERQIRTIQKGATDLEPSLFDDL